MKFGRRVQDTVVRAARPRWSHLPTSGAGATRYGGRFNPVGAEALYCSFDFNTAAREVRFALSADPYTFYFLAVDCEDIADLSDAQTRRSVGVSMEDLRCPHWESELYRGIEPSSHRAARRLIEAGYVGIIVRSFAVGATDDDLNLVLWQWEDVTESDKASRHAVRVLERSQLPPDGGSWAEEP